MFRKTDKPKKADPLKVALDAATQGLKLALAAMVSAKINDTDPDRLKAETVFEVLRTATEADLELLAAGAAQLETVAARLANTSTARPEDLLAVRTAANAAHKALAELKASEPKA